MAQPTIIDIRDVVFGYPNRPPVLAIDELTVARGQTLFLQGASGSGKSTLLGLLAGVLVANRGEVTVCSQPMKRLSGAQRDALRADRIGYIFQLFNLIPWLSVVENVLLPVRFSKRRRQQLADTAQSPLAEGRRLLFHLGLNAAMLGQSVAELSVGQQQRVAVARALIGAPDLVIADEPTSALDTASRQRFIDLLLSECRKSGTTLVFVSHDPSLRPAFDTAVDMAQINRVGGLE